MEENRKGYASQWEWLEELSAWLDLLLYLYYRDHQWLGPSSELKNMLGLVVTQEEFEHNLAKAAQRGLWTRLTPEDSAQVQALRTAMAQRLAATDPGSLPLLQLFARCGLDGFQQDCVAFTYVAALDRKYEKLLAYLQDDITRKTPDTSLAVELFLPAGGDMEEYLARFSRRDGFTQLFQPEPLAEGRLKLQDVVLEFLSTGSVADKPGLTLFDGAQRRPQGPLTVQGEVARQLDQVFLDRQTQCAVCLSGPPGSGKRFQVEHLMARQKAKCLFADLEGEDWEAKGRQAALAARLCGAYLCLCHLDRQQEGEAVPPPQQMVETIAGWQTGQNKVLLLSQLPLGGRLRRLAVELELPPLEEQERLALFRAELRGMALENVTCEELAAKFRFSPRQIHLACNLARGLAQLGGTPVVDGPLMHQCCYRQAVHKLGDLASRVPAAYCWDDVVLPAPQKRLMQQACGHIQYQHQVYYGWGFDKKISYGRGLSILFAGAPGTGKTMCAQVIARQLNMEMYKINISQIVSKYIGETEKNLQAVFTEARRANSILFFDECDALFGKRSEVKDSHDRNANVEVAYLLQQIEEYDGVCILATNLIGNIDAAFMRRITYVVHFPFPDAAMRRQIYRQTIPAGAPLDEDIDWDFLAEKFQLSGGHIKNIVLAAAFMAAGEGSPIAMRHLLRAAVNELKKNEIVVVREELREYQDLLDEPEEVKP